MFIKMAFRKKGRKRGGWKKKVAKEKHDVAKATVAEVKAIVHKATRHVGETKYVDVAAAYSLGNSGNGTTAGVLTGGIGQGLTDFAARIGDQINPTGLHMKGLTYAGTSSEPWRQILIQGKEENQNIPPITQILAYTDSTLRYLCNSPLKWDTKSTFKVLYDKVHPAVQQITGNTTEGHPWQIYVPGNKLAKVKYIGATTNAISGGLYYYSFSDSATNVPVTYFISRLTFKDP